MKPGWHYFGRKMVRRLFLSVLENSRTREHEREPWSRVNNASRLVAGRGRLRVDDVVHDIPQSYPFCSRWSRDLCKDSQPGGPKGVCESPQTGVQTQAQRHECVCVVGVLFVVECEF